MNMTPRGSDAASVDALALSGGLERLVLEFDKVRRSALRQIPVKSVGAYLLRLAGQPGGTRLGLFRERLGIADQRASQIARALETRRLVKRSRDRRVCVVSATRKGREALARFDAQLAEALQADLAKGDASPLQAAIAAVRLVAAPSAQEDEGHDYRKPSRTRKSGKRGQVGQDGPTLMDAVDNAD